MSGFGSIIIVGIELYIVQIHYGQQKLAAISNIVDVRWKYISKPKISSDYITTTRTGETTNNNQTVADDNESTDYIPIFVKNLRNTNSESCTTD